MSFRLTTANRRQAKEIVDLLNIYALDPMGGGEALRDNGKLHLFQHLPKYLRPSVFSLLCRRRSSRFGYCFQAFSNLACKPVNIHDVMVCDEYRGLGLCRRMLDKVEIARKDARKVTLEFER